MQLHYAVEPEPLDTAGAIRFAALDAGIDERFVVVNGDVLTDLDVSALVAFHDEHGAEGTIALHKVEDPSAFGVVPTDADGRVQAFVEKPPARRGSRPTYQRRHLRARAVGARPHRRGPQGLDRAGGLPRHGRRRHPLRHAPTTPTGSTPARPALYLRAQLDLLDGVRGDPVDGIDPSAPIVRRGVGRSAPWWASGAVIAAGAVVRESVVMAGARIGPGRRLERTVLAFGATVGAGPSPHDCVDRRRLDVVRRGRAVRRPHPRLGLTRRPRSGWQRGAGRAARVTASGAVSSVG